MGEDWGSPVENRKRKRGQRKILHFSILRIFRVLRGSPLYSIQSSGRPSSHFSTFLYKLTICQRVNEQQLGCLQYIISTLEQLYVIDITSIYLCTVLRVLGVVFQKNVIESLTKKLETPKNKDRTFFPIISKLRVSSPRIWFS